MLLLVTIVLVLVALVTLILGVVSDTLGLIYVSIGCSAAAGLVLIALSQLGKRRPVPATAGATAGGTESLAETRGQPAVGEREPARVGPSPDGEMFPIEEYDDLKVAEILPLLPELDLDELDMVREREEQGKNRASVLNRIDQLISEKEAEEGPAEELAPTAIGGVGGGGEFPIADYDDLKVAEILPLLEELDDDELDQVAEREEQGARRATILNRIDQLLGEEAVGVAPVKKAAPKKAAAKKATAKKSAAKKSAAKKAAPKKAAKKATAAKKAAKKR